MFQSSKNKLSKASSSSAHKSSSSKSTTSKSLNPALPSILQDGRPLPRLIVFDLDYTLWPFWVDTHVVPPLKPKLNGSSASRHAMAATDRTGEEFRFYPEVPSILWSLPQAGIKLGVASRTHAPDLGREMLKLLHIVPPPITTTTDGNESEAGGGKNNRNYKPRRAIEFFDQLEIYPSSKLRHFEALSKRTGIPHEQMLFFDDESRNSEVRQLGVTFWLVRDGSDWKEVEKGILQWRQDNQKLESTKN